MNLRQILAVATTAALLLPGTALAGKGNGKPTGKPEHAGPPHAERVAETPAADATTRGVAARTLEGPASPEEVPVDEVVAPPAEEAPAAEPAGKAHGKRCAGQRRKRVKGQRGTAFSRCVNALARVAAGKASPKAACKGLSKKHVKGTKGTPFSRCVVAAKKVAEEQPQEPVEEITEPVDPQPEPAPEQPSEPTEPVEPTDPVDAPLG